VLLVDDTHQLLYVGGMHTFACGDATCAVSDDDTVTTNRIGVYDLRTHTWSGLADDSGVGLNQTVSALALDDSSIYVGGFFTESTGGTQLSRIARWTWRPPSGTLNVTGDPGSTVTIGGQPATIDYSASSSTQLTVTIPGGLADGTSPISVTAVSGTATLAAVAVIGTTPTPPPAPMPPSAPIDVFANGDSTSAIVSWSAPRAPGSFPVTHYQVVVTPSGRTCLTTTLTCTVTGLPRGVAQTVRVRALNGAGWGPMSEAVPVPSIWLSARREGRQILLSGRTAGVGMGAIVTVWMETGKGFRERKRTTLVATDGTFTWATRLKRDVPLHTYVTVSSSRSNVITLR
jgi:hypothetical protein